MRSHLPTGAPDSYAAERRLSSWAARARDREVILDAIFSDRRTLLADVERATDPATRELARRALKSKDYLYDVFEPIEATPQMT